MNDGETVELTIHSIIKKANKLRSERDEAIKLLLDRCDAHDLPWFKDGGKLAYHNIQGIAKRFGCADDHDEEELWSMCHLTDNERAFLDKQ